jgi:hypothetical protein
MRRPGILVAAALVLSADGFVLVKAALNRSGPPAAAVEVTERELRLVRPQHESTAIFLELAWEPRWQEFKFEDGPGWFGKAKLEELGYDCRLSPADPAARQHYGAIPAKQAFAVLEYDDAAWRDSAEDRSTRSRLLAIDAGTGFALLRRKYPDPSRYLIVPSLVMLRHEAKWDANARRFAPGGYLRGAIVEMLVGQVSVPPSERRVLESLTEPTSDYFAGAEARFRGPRYSTVLYYGRNHEPWIGPCRRIAAAQ